MSSLYIPLRSCAALSAAVLLSSSTAWALPNLQTASDTDDDATITLKIPTQAIEGDTRTACEVRLVVRSTKVAFSPGDSVELGVWEDDPVGDDEVWGTVFQVTAAEISAGKVDRTFDCTGSFADDYNDELELYAEALVIKAGCGVWCSYDRPTTSNLDVARVADDDSEPNDSSSSPRPLTNPTLTNRVARNPDWWSITLPDGGDMELTVGYRVGEGRLTVALYGNDGSTKLASGVDSDSGTTVSASALAAGTYAVVVQPKQVSDPNFYDLALVLGGGGGGGGGGGSCTDGATQTIACGNCGTKTRSCTGGTWGDYGPCSGEGECTPDSDDNSVSCGICGYRSRTCSNTCQWIQGVCDDPCAESTAPLGDPCTSDGDCTTGMVCLGTPERPVFAGGYCSKVACTTDADCGELGLCGLVFGEAVCLRRCDSNNDCRQTYMCVPFEGEGACIPPCKNDGDCRDSEYPLCNTALGLCHDGQSDDGSGWSGEKPLDDASTPQSVERQGCAAAAPSWMSLAALGVLVALRRRRR